MSIIAKNLGTWLHSVHLYLLYRSNKQSPLSYQEGWGTFSNKMIKIWQVKILTWYLFGEEMHVTCKPNNTLKACLI